MIADHQSVLRFKSAPRSLAEIDRGSVSILIILVPELVPMDVDGEKRSADGDVRSPATIIAATASRRKALLDSAELLKVPYVAFRAASL